MDLREKTSNTLLSTTNVDLSAMAQTNLFTVPVGKTLIVTKAVLVAGADTGATTLSIGQAGATTDFIGLTNLQTCATDDAFYLEPTPSVTPAIQKAYPAGTVIQLDVSVNLGGATNAVKLFGYLY